MEQLLAPSTGKFPKLEKQRVFHFLGVDLKRIIWYTITFQMGTNQGYTNDSSPVAFAGKDPEE